jgi:hypothetical protein
MPDLSPLFAIGLTVLAAGLGFMGSQRQRKVGVFLTFLAGVLFIISWLMPAGNSLPPDAAKIEHNTGNAAIVNGSGNIINQHNESKQAEDLSGLLVPADEPTPSPARECLGDGPGPVVLLGNCATVLAGAAPAITVLKLRQDSLLTIEREAGGAYVSALILREDGRVVARLTRNKFEVNPNNYFDEPLHPDRHELRITRHGELVFRVRFANERAFLIEGSFFIPGHGTLAAKASGLFMADDPNPFLSNVCTVTTANDTTVLQF